MGAVPPDLCSRVDGDLTTQGMVSGYVLIVAVLMLGGVIATLGDRIGMRVGKARLSLFNLRPRQTATLVSIATGSVISASTLALLFGISSQLRTGVFELRSLQESLAEAEADLETTEAAKVAVETDLDSARQERERALERLQDVNRSLEQAVDQQALTQRQLQQTKDQLGVVSQQTAALRQDTAALRSERDQLVQQQARISAQIAARDADIAARDADIAARDADIAQREQRLQDLQTRQDFLVAQVAELERQYQGLFLGNIALERNQELVFRVVQATTPSQAPQIVDQLLFEANQVALQRIVPGTPIDRQVILISNQDVERLVTALMRGDEYVLRILSAANYITGESCVVQGQEPCVQVFVDASPNQLIYPQNEGLASTSLDGNNYTERLLVEQVNLLLSAAQFRARQDGVVGDSIQIADNRIETLIAFLEAVRDYGQPLDLQVVAAAPIYTSGPLLLDLVALQNGQALFRTGARPTSVPAPRDPAQTSINPLRRRP